MMPKVMTPSLERTAALLEDRAVMERLLHDAANYAWEHHGPASSRAFFDRVKVALANYDALLAEVTALLAAAEGDTKRLDWLAEKNISILAPMPDETIWQICPPNRPDPVEGFSLREAIDAARAVPAEVTALASTDVLAPPAPAAGGWRATEVDDV